MFEHELNLALIAYQSGICKKCPFKFFIESVLELLVKCVICLKGKKSIYSRVYINGRSGIFYNVLELKMFFNQV